MKKAIVYILAGVLLLAALAGCTNSGDANRVDPTATPAMPAVSTVPDVNDGVVNDNDGIIDEDDNGGLATQAPAVNDKGTASGKTSPTPGTTAKPGATAKP